MPKPNMSPAAWTVRFTGFGGLFAAFIAVFEPATAVALALAAYVVIASSK